MLLPINADESIDYTRLADELDQMILAVPDGMYSNGTAGELHNQTEAEFDKVQEIMAAKCQAAGVLFQIGANHPSPSRLPAAHAKNGSAETGSLPGDPARLVTTGAGEQVSFLQKMAETADGIPLVLHNPPHAKKYCILPSMEGRRK